MHTLNVYPVTSWVLFFVLATGLGMVLTYLVRDLALHYGWTTMPARHHIHKTLTPRFGGIAIFCGFVLLFILAAVMGRNPTWREQSRVLLPASILFVVGLVDDFREVPARVKLAFQVFAGVLLFFYGVRLFEADALSILGWEANLSYAAALLATVGWVVLITNAVNLTDGLDGLAAGSCLFSTVALLGLALAGGNGGVVFATLVLGGTVLGFLRYNFNPASIFLGDSGSLFLGCMLSGLALQAKQAAAPTLIALVIPLVSFGLPVVETAISVVRRFLGRRPLFAPDQDHFHHRLLRMGFTHRQAVIALYGVCAICALLSLFLLSPLRPVVGLVLIVVGGIFCVGIRRLGYTEFREISHLAKRVIEQTSLVPNDINVRNCADQIRRCTSAQQLTAALDSLIQIADFDSYRLVILDCGKIVGRAPVPDVSVEYEDRRRAAWEVSIDLELDGNRPLGQLTLRREYRRCNVLIDLNLLFNELEPAVSAACARLQASKACAASHHLPGPEFATTGNTYVALRP